MKFMKNELIYNSILSCLSIAFNNLIDKSFKELYHFILIEKKLQFYHYNYWNFN